MPNSMRQGIWFVALLGVFVSCLAASWLSLARFNYAYGVWYELFEIEQHIDIFGPQNNFKQGFAELPKAERQQAFVQISQAVHQQGEGLKTIHYHYAGQEIQLLTKDEITHLQDVANLISWLKKTALWIAVLSFLLLVYLFKTNSLLQLKKQLLWLFGLIGVSTLVVLVVGAKKVFYQMHIWIFPEGHPWFFYYQDSLMSTMMKAPDLFAGIAVAIITGAIVLFMAALLAVRALMHHRQFKNLERV